MDKNIWVLLALSAAPAITLAQAAPRAMGTAADPATPAASINYQSAFDTAPSGVVSEIQNWAKANAAVGQFQRGHMDIVRWERAQEAAASTAEPGKAPKAQEGAR